MDKSLNDFLIKMRDDLSQMRHIREYLDSNVKSPCPSGAPITWKTIEAFNMILASCKTNYTQNIQALNTILDSFYYVTSNNTEDSIWNHFGFELGVICSKILFVIEQNEHFEELFCKLLSILDFLSKYTSEPWKSVARHILNVLINKKISTECLENVLKIYTGILKNIDDAIVLEFARKNFHLIKTFSNMIQRVGDFEIQTYVMEVVFLLISNDENLTKSFISESVSHLRNVTKNLSFSDFDEDNRVFLNAVNKNLDNARKVFSLNCKQIALGGYSLDPPCGKKSLWLDANASTKRFSTKCQDVQPESFSQCVILIQFADVISIRVELQPEDQNRIIIKAKNLSGILPFVRTNEMICTTKPSQCSRNEVLQFKNFLEDILSRSCDRGEIIPQSCDEISVNRTEFKDKCRIDFGTDNRQTNLEKNGLLKIIPNALALLSKVENEIKDQDTTTNPKLLRVGSKEPNQIKNASDHLIEERISFHQENVSILPSLSVELSPASFVESLNKNIGLASPGTSKSLDSSLSVLMFQESLECKGSHKLYHRSNATFEFLDDKSESVTFTREKQQKQEKSEPLNSSKMVLSTKYDDSQSDHFFRDETFLKTKKPCLPKLKNHVVKKKSRSKTVEEYKFSKEGEYTPKPSLLDPNGYAYKRWSMPTTSERSKFWLDKIKALEEKKKVSGEIFEFTDESDEDIRNKKKSNIKFKRTPKVQNAKRNRKNPKVKQSQNKKKNVNRKSIILEGSCGLSETIPKSVPAKSQGLGTEEYTVNEPSENYIENSVNNYYENVTRNVPKKKKSVDEHIKDSLLAFPTMNYENQVPVKGSYTGNRQILTTASRERSDRNEPKEDHQDLLSNIHHSPRYFSTNYDEFKLFELRDADVDIDISDIENMSIVSGKRKFYEDEYYSQNESKKKKSDADPDLQVIMWKERMENFQKKMKRETDEIVETFNAAITHFINRLQKKQVSNIIAYIKKVQSSVPTFREPDLSQKKKNIQKVYVYYKTKCFSSSIYNAVREHISTTEIALQMWRMPKKYEQNVLEKFSNRLETLIETEIQNLMQEEMETFRNWALHFVSRLNSNFDFCLEYSN